MDSAMYEAIAFVMKYWFIIVIGIMLFSMAAVSLSEYRQRKNIIGEVTQHKGYIEIMDDNPDIDGTRIGIMEENLVGSSRSADIYITHPSIQKNHARMTMRDGKLFLTPLNNSEVKINGRRAAKTHRIFTGDVVTFGELDVYVYIKERGDEDDD